MLYTQFFIAEDDFELATSHKHLQRRLLADEHHRLNAQRMKSKYDRRRVCTFELGDVVSLRIRRIDRAFTDFHRLPCIVVQRSGTKHLLYRLQCAHGVLNTCYPGGELESYTGSLSPYQLEVSTSNQCA